MGCARGGGKQRDCSHNYAEISWHKTGRFTTPFAGRLVLLLNMIIKHKIALPNKNAQCDK